MPLASGLGSQLGLKKESVYGTAVTVDKFYEFDSESFALDQNFNDSVGLKAGRTVQPSGRMRATTRQAAGAVPMQVPTKLFGTILDLLHGLAPTVVQQAATIAYLQTHLVGTSQPNKSATVQINKPDDAANDHAFTYPGGVLTAVTFSCDAGGVLTCTLTWDLRDETTPSTTPAGAALASASYATGVTSWIGTDAGVTISVNGSAFAEATSWTLTWSQPFKTDRFYMGAGGLKGKPIPNGFASITGEISGDWNSETLYGLYRAGGIIAAYADFQGNTIASTYKEQIKFTTPAIQLRGGGTQVGGPDVLGQTIPFTAGDDGTNPPLKIEYMATDTAV